MFSEIFHERFVNNIYFDSPNLKFFLDTIEGSAHKIKVRIRWYGNLFGFIKKPVLELKIKKGLVARKESLSLHSFKLDSDFNSQIINKVIHQSDIPEIIKQRLKDLSPTLLNRYRRKYFQSADENYRITTDSDLNFYQIYNLTNTFLNRRFDNINVILELKYGHTMDSKADCITNLFPFRLTKSSKYVTGIEAFLF